MTGRMILINKAHPKIPTINEMRPIVSISPIRKLMEMQLLPKLKNYINKEIKKSQTGFVEKLGTNINLFRYV
jgi:hypothetical protein